MAAVKAFQVVRDPEVRIGALRLMQRTDGKWIAVDERRAPGDRTVFVDKERSVVERWMRESADAAASGN